MRHWQSWDKPFLDKHFWNGWTERQANRQTKSHLEVGYPLEMQTHSTVTQFSDTLKIFDVALVLGKQSNVFVTLHPQQKIFRQGSV